MLSYHPGADDVGPIEAPHVVPASAGQVPNAILNAAIAPWNRLDLLEQILKAKGDRIAAVFMEPVLCNSGCLLPSAGYLEGVRDLCRAHGVAACFRRSDHRLPHWNRRGADALRRHSGSGHVRKGRGRRRAAQCGGRTPRDHGADVHGGVVFGGTFNGNPVSLAAAEVTLEELSNNDGEALAEANRLGYRLMDGIAEIVRRYGAAAVMTGFGTAFAIHFTSRMTLTDYRDTLADDSARLRRFLFRALQEGLYIVPDGRFYTSAVHTEKELDQTLEAIERVFADPTV